MDVVRRGGFFARLLAPLFPRTRIEPETLGRIQKAYASGVVVHVFRSSRVLDPLFILNLLGRLGLPKPRWMHDHYAAQLDPSAGALARVVQQGEPALLFLRRPRTLAQPNSAYSERHVEALLAVQRQLDRPILLLPESLVWTERAGSIRRTIIDVVFGNREAPGRIRELLGFLARARDARFHAGNPVDLQAALELNPRLEDRLLAKKVRWTLLNHLAREEALRSGPVERSPMKVRQHVLRDPQVLRLLSAQPAEIQKAEENRAAQILDRIAADPRHGWLRVLDAVIDRVWNEIYDGIVVDRAGLEAVWVAARRGPIVLVPSHKSHADYLVLSQVFFRDGMMPPHIAAGDNLSFWPLGPILRKAGAFFIRRSFKGDKLYATICAAYIRRLMKEGHAVEFFIEGGRSRTGKMLDPKLGILRMCVDPVLEGAVADACFVPISITYEKIVEASAYAAELGGAKKRKEDVAGLLSSRKILRSRYGRVYVDFDEPLSLRAFAAARGIDLNQTEDSGTRHLVTQLGHRLVYGIHRVSRITPTGIAALALLSQTRRGMGEAELYERASRLCSIAEALGARLSESLKTDPKAAVREALGRFAQDGDVLMLPAPDGETIFVVEERGRKQLDYYKNNTLPHFAPLCIVLVALRSMTSTPARVSALQEAAKRLSLILKYEIAFRQDSSFEENFRRALGQLESLRIVRCEGEGEDRLAELTHFGKKAGPELAGALTVFLECYRFVALGLTESKATFASEKELAARALQLVQRCALEGRISSPEAASAGTIANALKLFAHLGILQKSEDISAATPRDKSALEALLAELDRFLNASRA